MQESLHIEEFAHRFSPSGGKVKPLKAAKKEKKELDEDDLAFKKKQQAGMCHRSICNRSLLTVGW